MGTNEIMDKFKTDIGNIESLFNSECTINKNTQNYFIMELERMVEKAKSLHISETYSKEIWKDVERYKGIYQVSNFGRLRSKYNSIISGHINQYGYIQVTLSKDKVIEKMLLHRLIAETFIANPNNLPQINHKDYNKTNNRIDNLEWCDARYNINYNDPIRKGGIPIIAFDKRNKKIIRFETFTEATNNGFDRNGIESSLRRKGKLHKGFEWFYANKERTSKSKSMEKPNPKMFDLKMLID